MTLSNSSHQGKKSDQKGNTQNALKWILICFFLTTYVTSFTVICLLGLGLRDLDGVARLWGDSLHGEDDLKLHLG